MFIVHLLHKHEIWFIVVVETNATVNYRVDAHIVFFLIPPKPYRKSIALVLPIFFSPAFSLAYCYHYQLN